MISDKRTIISSGGTFMCGLVRWSSVHRFLGNESIPDEESYVFVRVPPPPPGQAENPATPSQSPNPERSPR